MDCEAISETAEWSLVQLKLRKCFSLKFHNVFAISIEAADNMRMPFCQHLHPLSKTILSPCYHFMVTRAGYAHKQCN